MPQSPFANSAVSAPADRRSPWYAAGLAFVCLRCGRCCGGAPGYVWVSPQEAAAIATHLQMSPEDFRHRHLRRVGRRWSLLELANGDCEFLGRDADGKARCVIHPVRPRQCQTWPFWASNLRSRRLWEAAARVCPGIGQGAVHPLPVIEAALRGNERAALPF